MSVPDHQRAEVIAIDQHIPKPPSPKFVFQYDATPVDLDRLARVLAKILEL